mmetsp:Transcript_76567/g.212682  ORF Transcript_76567/g.212682 Transcript_76567/m.212682 type:complete len:350 (+) Transcript_76567:143-1192(+)
MQIFKRAWTQQGHSPQPTDHWPKYESADFPSFGFMPRTRNTNSSKSTCPVPSLSIFFKRSLTLFGGTFSPMRGSASFSSCKSNCPLWSSSKNLNAFLILAFDWSQRTAETTACAFSCEYPRRFMFSSITPAFRSSRGLRPSRFADHAVEIAENIELDEGEKTSPQSLTVATAAAAPSVPKPKLRKDAKGLSAATSPFGFRPCTSVTNSSKSTWPELFESTSFISSSIIDPFSPISCTASLMSSLSSLPSPFLSKCLKAFLISFSDCSPKSALQRATVLSCENCASRIFFAAAAALRASTRARLMIESVSMARKDRRMTPSSESPFCGGWASEPGVALEALDCFWRCSSS